MTDLLDRAIEAARSLPSSVQDSIAVMVMDVVEDAAGLPILLTEAEKKAIAVSRAQAADGAFASDEDVRADLGQIRSVIGRP